MGQWFLDNLWLLALIGVVVVIMAAYLASQLYRDRRERAAAAKVKRQGAPWPNPHSLVAESHIDIGFADVSGHQVLMVTLNSERDVQALGRLMSLLGEGVDLLVVKSEFIDAHTVRCVTPGVWAVRSESEEDWVVLRTEDVLVKLEHSAKSPQEP